MDVHLTEDEMADIKKDVLNKLRPFLCEKIRAERHFDFLRSRRILTRDDAEEMTCQPTQTKRTSTLLDILSDDPRGLDVLIESIQLSRCQNFIVAKITDEVLKAKNEKIEALRASRAPPPTNNLGAGDFSKVYSEDSTMLYHPDGEGSPCASALPGSLDPKKAGQAAVWNMPVSSSTASTLPRPGDPGAPALLEEMLAEESLSPGAELESLRGGRGGGRSGGGDGGGGSSGDQNFQPLRSRSISPATCSALPTDQERPKLFLA